MAPWACMRAPRSALRSAAARPAYGARTERSVSVPAPARARADRQYSTRILYVVDLRSTHVVVEVGSVHCNREGERESTDDE